MGRFKEVVHIGVGGSVVAVDIKSGEIVWSTKLKSHQFVSLIVRGDRVYAGAAGELFCLSAGTGELLWHNKLKGFGMSFLTFAGTDSGPAAAAAAQAAAAHAAT